MHSDAPAVALLLLLGCRSSCNLLSYRKQWFLPNVRKCCLACRKFPKSFIRYLSTLKSSSGVIFSCALCSRQSIKLAAVDTMCHELLSQSIRHLLFLAETSFDSSPCEVNWKLLLRERRER